MDDPDVGELISRLRHKSISLWLEEDQLRYRTPKGSLTAQDITALRERKPEIIKYLQRAAVPVKREPRLERRPPDARVPLSFSQRWLWNVWDLQRRTFRTVYVATSVTGPLDVEILQKCVDELVRSHEPLRTRIVTVDGIPLQAIDAATCSELDCVDLATIPPETRDTKAKQLIRGLIAERIDPAVGPLFVIKLLRLSDNEHILVAVLDHLIADGASVRIFLQALFTSYARSLEQLPLSVTESPVQFADFAWWQHETESHWTEKHGLFWEQRLAGARRLRLSERLATPAVASRAVTCPVAFGRELSDGLRDLSKREHTTLALSVLTAYAASLLRWCNQTDLVLPFTIAGRLKTEVDHTIGYFSCPLFLRLRVREGDTLLDLMRHVTEEYGEAYKHCDAGRIAAAVPSPSFEPNPSFNWLPLEFGGSPADFLQPHDAARLRQSVRLQAFDIEDPYADIPLDHESDREPALIMVDSEEGVTGSLAYVDTAMPMDDVKRFSATLRHFAERLLGQPDALVTELACIS